MEEIGQLPSFKRQESNNGKMDQVISFIDSSTLIENFTLNEKESTQREQEPIMIEMDGDETVVEDLENQKVFDSKNWL